MMRYFVLVVGFLVLAPMLGHAGEKPRALGCDVVFIENTSAPNQKRMQVFIWVDSQNILDFLATGELFAIKAISQTSFDYIDVFVMNSAVERKRGPIGRPNSVASVGYAPDPSVIPFMDAKWKGSIADITEINERGWTMNREFLNSSQIEKINFVNTGGACEMSAEQITELLPKEKAIPAGMTIEQSNVVAKFAEILALDSRCSSLVPNYNEIGAALHFYGIEAIELEQGGQFHDYFRATFDKTRDQISDENVACITGRLLYGENGQSGEGLMLEP